MRSNVFLALAAFLACDAGIATAAYTLEDKFDTSNFFNSFSMFTAPDPTNGFVNYQGAVAANQTGLAGYSAASNTVYLGVDSQTVNPVGGRDSIRVSSNKAYNHGLFISDIAHMPDSTCGVWPALWTVGTGSWPGSGEIDILEGVNEQSSNIITLHTSAGCTLNGTGALASSKLGNTNCNNGDAHDGCGFSTANSQSYGTGFNTVGGGIYAMEWTSSAIKVFFFPRSSIPNDITSGSPDPSNWGTPLAAFSSVGSGCDIDSHFQNHQIVFDTTFCGDWAGNVWGSSSCASKAATCNDFVAQNPAAFANSYWEINSVKVYQDPSAAKRGVPTPFVA